MRKSLGIQKCDGHTDLPTDLPTDTARCRDACTRLRIAYRENAKKIKKILKIIILKISIPQTCGWRHLKEKNKLFLSYEYQKMYHPSREMAQLPQVPQIENGKPDFSPTFQKVELHNSPFYELVILLKDFYFFLIWDQSQNFSSSYLGVTLI